MVKVDAVVPLLPSAWRQTGGSAGRREVLNAWAGQYGACELGVERLVVDDLDDFSRVHERKGQLHLISSRNTMAHDSSCATVAPLLSSALGGSPPYIVWYGYRIAKFMLW